MKTETTTDGTAKSRFTVPLDHDVMSDLERRAAEERIPKTAHVRRLIAKDAAANPAAAVAREVADLPAAA